MCMWTMWKNCYLHWLPGIGAIDNILEPVVLARDLQRYTQLHNIRTALRVQYTNLAAFMLR